MNPVLKFIQSFYYLGLKGEGPLQVTFKSVCLEAKRFKVHLSSFFLLSTATQGFFFPALCCGDWYKYDWAQPLCEEGGLSLASHIRIGLKELHPAVTAWW